MSTPRPAHADGRGRRTSAAMRHPGPSVLPALRAAGVAGCATLLSAALLLATPALAHDPDVPVEAETPPRLLQQATPTYPDGATGEAVVVVLVRVSRSGEVLDVTASEGPEAFVPAARDAARRLVFAPATRAGNPVEATLGVTFRFASPSGNDDDVAFEVVVAAARPDASDTHARTTLDGRALDRTRGQDFAEVIGQVSGVTVARGAADASKPIIRGQYERRLLVLYDGVRHASQKWGADHATEIDPFSAGSISVIKGAAGVRYGPDAIGGVVLVAPPPLRTEPGVGGSAQLVGVSNGRRGIGALRLDAAPEAVDGLAFRVEGNFGRGGALSAPDYILGNTASQQWNAGVTAQVQRESATWTMSWRRYDMKAGICYCTRSDTIDGFLGQLDAPAPIGADGWTADATIERPYQSVTHDLALARAAFVVGGGSLTATYALQVNDRQEFEQVRGSVEGPQYDFLLRTHSLDVEATHGGLRVPSLGRLEGGLGLAGSFQENVYRGLALVPNHRSFTGGVYAVERLAAGRVDLEVGGRYDRQSRTSFLSDEVFERHLRRGTLGEDDCALSEDTARCGLTFDTGSATVGGLWHVVEDRVDLKVDLSSASRFPNGDELYVNGSAPTSPVYALGDPDLGVETTRGVSPTLGLRARWFEAEASAYANWIDDYIYFAPELGPSGAPSFDVTIRGAYPRFAFRPVDVLFYGADGGISLGPDAPVGLTAQGALVRGVSRVSGEPLLFVPPPRVRGAVIGRLPDLDAWSQARIEVSGEYVAEQTHVVPGADLAPPPDAFFLLGASAAGEVTLRGGRTVRVGVEGANLLNARYRDYTSLLRYFSDEPGREVRLRLGLEF